MTTTRSDRALGIEQGTVIQMVGWDDDCDQRLIDSVTDAAGAPPVDDDYDDVVDVVVLWWRDDDGDLVDGLLDAIAMLAEKGAIWLVTPKPGRDGHVEPEEISEAAPTAGLRVTANISAAPDWNGTRLVPRS
ncbi:MAG: DUF3052 family protein [Candidatus Nanopelagicales bacterium]